MGTMTNWQMEQEFRRLGPFTHLYSSPVENDLLVENDEDRKVLMNMMALVSRELNLDVMAYAIMSNHLHLMINGDSVQARLFFDSLIRRLTRYMASKGKAQMLSKIACGTTPITSLNQFRTEVAYIIRNPFVVREDINLFSYKWCSGYLYFNNFLDLITGKQSCMLTYRERRQITRTSNDAVPDGLLVSDGMVLPHSFVNYKVVEYLFGSARQYLHWVLKNVEAQVETSLRYGESPSLSDDELFQLTCSMCKSRYGVQSVKELSDNQKKEMAITLRNQYHASNGQMARLTGLSLHVVNQMYPLSAKR